MRPTASDVTVSIPAETRDRTERPTALPLAFSVSSRCGAWIRNVHWARGPIRRAQVCAAIVASKIRNIHADIPAMMFISVARPTATASPTRPPNADPLADPIALPIHATERLMRTPPVVPSACSFETWRPNLVVASARFAVARRSAPDVSFEVTNHLLGKLLQDA